MSAITFLKLSPPQYCTASSVVFYTVTATPSTTLLRNAVARFTNTDTDVHLVTVHAVPSGGSPDATNILVPAKAVAVNDYLDVVIPELESGDAVYIKNDVGTTDVVAHFLSGHLLAP